MLTILYDLLISGMVAAALVPVLSEYSAPERRAELRRIVGTLLTLATLVLSAVTILLVIFAPQLVTLWLQSGSGTIDDALIPEAIRNVRFILPAVMLLGLSAIIMSTNYALGRFAWPSIAQAARNGAIIIATILLARTFGVTSMVIGVLAGGVLLVALQLPGLRDVRPVPALALRHPAIRRIFRLYAPIFIGLFANTIGQLIDRNLAWNRAGDDALGAMRYATTLQQLVLGLVATGIALGALPALSRQAESGDESAFRSTLNAALRMTTVLIAPASLGLLALAAPIVNLIFRHGATDAAGASVIVLALIWYIPGTFFQAFDQLLINVFYARRNTLTPQLVGVAAVVLYIAVELTLVGRFGMVALVAAISVQWTFHAIVMYWLARHLLTPADHHAFCLGVAAVMAAVAWGTSQALERTLPGPDLVREVLILALPVALGAAVYAWGITRLGIDDFAILARRVVAKVRGT
jgi:putative peptidoglycan lipid II flippase